MHENYPQKGKRDIDMGECELVLATYDDVQGVGAVISLAGRAAVPCTNIIVYAKGADVCEQVKADVDVQREVNATNSSFSCEQLDNVGREQHTLAHHVSSRWEQLAAKIIFVPLPMDGTVSGSGCAHPGRRRLLERALRALADPTELPHGFYSCMPPCTDPDHDECYPVPGGADEPNARRMCSGFRGIDETRFEVEEYPAGHPLILADVRPLGAWAGVYLNVPAAALNHAPVCYEGALCTTREYVQSRPRELYVDLTRQLGVGDGVEAVHYMERLMLVAYGPRNFTSPTAGAFAAWPAAAWSPALIAIVIGLSATLGALLLVLLLWRWRGLLSCVSDLPTGSSITRNLPDETSRLVSQKLPQ